MIEAAFNGSRPLYDPRTGRFDPVRLRLALVLRRLSTADLVTRSGISSGAVKNARRGDPVKERTASAILAVIDATPAMDIGQECCVA